MEFDFNLNEKVGVKLTEEGLKILESKYNEKQKTSPLYTTFEKEPFKAPQVDEEGYSYFSLWELIEFFGECAKDLSSQPFVDMDIKISGNDLVEHTQNKTRNF